MQLVIHIELDEPLLLPVNYNHILQAVIYRSLDIIPGYAEFLHEGGFMRGQRQYKMFQFSQLKGEYRIENKKKFSMEYRYYISSAALTSEQFASAVRGHWAIESVPQAHKFAA